LADCNNTEGGFTCTCQNGYIGDGFNCTGKLNSLNDKQLGQTKRMAVIWLSWNAEIYVVFCKAVQCSHRSTELSPWNKPQSALHPH